MSFTVAKFPALLQLLHTNLPLDVALTGHDAALLKKALLFIRIGCADCDTFDVSNRRQHPQPSASDAYGPCP